MNVSWNDAVAFCKWLSKKEDKNYKLPSEAEWEYACRAGTKTRYYCGDEPEALAKVANVADATAKARFPDWIWGIKASDGYVFTAPVGSFKPNAFGLYDMHGNAYQWCRIGMAKTTMPGRQQTIQSGQTPDVTVSFAAAPGMTGRARAVPPIVSMKAPDYRISITGFRVAVTP